MLPACHELLSTYCAWHAIAPSPLCRESAERALQEATGGELRTFTVGNPPAAFHPL